MKTKKASGYRRLQQVLILFYIVMAALPVMTCVTAYYQSLQFVIDREMESQSSLAQVGMEQVAFQLRDADDYTASLMGMQQFETWVRTTDASPSTQVRCMQTLLNNFPTLNNSSGVFTRCYVYSALGNTILDKNSGYLNIGQYYEKLFALEGYDQERWETEILRDRQAARFLPSSPDGRGDTILYSKRIAYGNRHGRIIFYLNVPRLLSFFGQSEIPPTSGFLTLYDREGNILYTSAAADTAPLFSQYGVFSGYQPIEEDGPMILSATALPNYGWTLYIATPRAYFAQNALQISFGILRGLLPLLLLSILLMILLLRNSHRPLHQTLTRLPASSQGQTLNPFKYVQQQVDLLSEANQLQEAQLAESRSALREAIVSTLVYQKQEPGSPLTDKLRELGISLDSDLYRALVLTLCAPSGEAIPITDRMHMVILGLAEGYAGCIRYLKMDSPERMLFLALLEDTKDRFDQMQNRLNSFCRDIAQTLACDARVYVGPECDQLANVYHSFKTARHLLSLRPAAEGYLVCAREKEVAPAYDYPSEDARQLRQLASTGNAEALQALLSALQSRNSGAYARTPFEKQLLCAHMLSTLLTAGYQGPLDDEIVRSLSDIPLDRFFELLEKYYIALCEQSRNSEKTEQRERMNEILEAIGKNYSDYEMSASSLSLQFGLSDRRLSALIKEETGLTFADYLEKTRIDRALELLHSGSQTIEEIALAVGYASDKSFRRAFKRRTGQSPSAFRVS